MFCNYTSYFRIVRNIMLQLQEAGIIEVKQGPGGITINRPLSEITYLDIY